MVVSNHTTMITQASQMRVISVIVSCDAACLSACSQVFARIKAKTGHLGKSANRHTVIQSALCLRGIFYQKKLVFISDCFHSADVKWLSVQMNPNNCFRVFCNPGLNAGCIYLPRV